MKILHILNELKFSGAEVLLKSGFPYLSIHNSDNTILSTGEVVGAYNSELERTGYKITHIPFRRNISYFLDYIRFIRGNKFDVIHCHSERANFWHCLIAIFCARRVVRTVHNCFPFEGKLRLFRSIQRHLLQKFGVVFVACSGQVARNELERFGLKAKVITNWVDLARVSPRSTESRAKAREKYGLQSDEFCVVSLANYGPLKNQEAIIAAMRECSKRFRVTYLHCGSGGEDLSRKMNVGPQDPIRFLGAVSDVDEILAASDAFVSASFFEGGPIALLEAARAGTVCVVTKVGFADEFSGLANVVFIEPNAESLVEALSTVEAKSEDDRLTGGAVLSEFATEHFSPKVGASLYMDAYRTN